MKRVLMISYVFPPYFGSSGNLRVLGFARYLPEFGWEPSILTAHPRSYSQVNEHLLQDVPNDLHVSRAFALDARKHLSIMGKYPIFLAQPDRWSSWWLGAVPMGLRMIKKYRPDVIWSTYPIPTSHLVAATLSAITRIPWVADYRDPMNLTDAGDSDLSKRVRDYLDRITVQRAKRVVFTAPGASRIYSYKYAKEPHEKWVVIQNGYDERQFSDIKEAENRRIKCSDPVMSPCIMLHSGYIYPKERNPVPLFRALARLKERKILSRQRMQLILRASGNEKYFDEVIHSLNIQDIVHLKPNIPYREALLEMARADVLLLLQGRGCEYQIPAKIYEYFRIGRPIFALSRPNSDTGNLVTRENAGTVVDIEDEVMIEKALVDILKKHESGKLESISSERIPFYSRRHRAKELSDVLDSIIKEQC